MIQHLGILFMVLLLACNSLVVTDKEVAAVGKVLDFYGGICGRSKGVSMENGETEKYFELELKESKLIEKQSKMLGMPASNIAYIFYSNLGEEQAKYTHVRVKLKLNDGSTYEHSYPVKELSEIEELIPILFSVTDKIRVKNYGELLSYFETDSSGSIMAETLREYCAPYDSAYGDAIKTQFQGYSYVESEKSKRILANLIGIIRREKENTPISLLIDRNTRKIASLKFSF